MSAGEKRAKFREDVCKLAAAFDSEKPVLASAIADAYDELVAAVVRLQRERDEAQTAANGAAAWQRMWDECERERERERVERRAHLEEGFFELWDGRAKRLVEQALAEWESEEQHANLSAALACLRIADGDLPPDDLEGYPFPGEETVVECICPPELLSRADTEATP